LTNSILFGIEDDAVLLQLIDGYQLGQSHCCSVISRVFRSQSIKKIAKKCYPNLFEVRLNLG